MAFLNVFEKSMIEAAFDMEGGFVLDFNNGTFADFIEEILGFDPYSKPQYAKLSKAKILRNILKDEPDTYVGKLILKLIEYRKFKGISNSGDKYIQDLVELGRKKLGKSSSKAQNHVSQETQLNQDFNAKKHLDELLSIDNSQYTPQQKGYAFERFLSKLFEELSLSPRASYKTDTDQIDGSFILDGNTVLIEAKYRSSYPSKDDLILFANKIATKSKFARGLFICQARIPDSIVDYFKLREGKTIIAMTVEELYMILNESQDLVQVLQHKLRYLDETGIIFKNYRELL